MSGDFRCDWHACSRAASVTLTARTVYQQQSSADFRRIFSHFKREEHRRMSMTIEKTKYECAALPKRYPRDETSHRAKGPGAPPAPAKVEVMYYGRGAVVRNDASLVPPIRQTASIFKQPVTVHKSQESKVKSEHSKGSSNNNNAAPSSGSNGGDKPKQLMWEKRLEGLRACDPDGTEFEVMELPRGLRPVGPNVCEETIIQSVATALHVSAQPVTGQTGSRTGLEKNPGVYLDPKQPLVQAVNISEDDIRRQEERVAMARRKLQEALRVE